MYTFADPYECWNWVNTHTADEPYAINPKLTLKYVNTGERSDYLGIWEKTKTITTIYLKRNMLTTVNITVEPDLSGVHYSLSEEPFAGENEINIGVQGGSLIDITVNPNE